MDPDRGRRGGRVWLRVVGRVASVLCVARVWRGCDGCEVGGAACGVAVAA